jgi:hypothetical protein
MESGEPKHQADGVEHAGSADLSPSHQWLDRPLSFWAIRSPLRLVPHCVDHPKEGDLASLFLVVRLYSFLGWSHSAVHHRTSDTCACVVSGTEGPVHLRRQWPRRDHCACAGLRRACARSMCACGFHMRLRSSLTSCAFSEVGRCVVANCFLDDDGWQARESEGKSCGLGSGAFMKGKDVRWPYSYQIAPSLGGPEGNINPDWNSLPCLLRRTEQALWRLCEGAILPAGCVCELSEVFGYQCCQLHC